MGHLSASGEPMIRNKGIIFKAEGVALRCPKCGSDVPLSGELAKALQDRIVVFVKPPTKAR